MPHHARLIRPAFVVAIALGLVVLADAANRKEKLKKAQQLTKEALHRETYAEQSERENLLSKAAELAPEFEPAKWHQGFLKHNKAWMSVEDAGNKLESNRHLDRYREMRLSVEDTAAGHLELANWCRKVKLSDQERAHLTRILDTVPDHEEARRRLGFRRVEGVWQKDSELQSEFQEAMSRRKNLAKWLPKLEKIREGLASRHRERREAAATKLREIHDLSALPALEVMVMSDDPDAGAVAIETIAAMPEYEAAHALARVSVFAPWEATRDAAADQLKSRKIENYVPMLLAEIYTPVESRTQMVRAPSGRLIFRQRFVREAQNERQEMMLDTGLRRIARPGGNAADTAQRAMVDLFMTSLAREQQRQRQNQITGQLNNRIMATLARATEAEVENQPKEWWDWWNSQNEVFVSAKSTNRIYRAEERTYTDEVSSPFSGGTSGGSSGPSPARSDCLAAGTPIWTTKGLKAVERIQVGDLVLSQDTESGEIAYKAVVRTTVRPRGKLVVIRTPSETIKTSGGHLFFVAGEGWMKSRNLKSGMVLHGMRQISHLSAVETGEEEETYNLVVEDFHTYFVGRHKILSHDNTVRRPTNATVPGLHVE